MHKLLLFILTFPLMMLANKPVDQTEVEQLIDTMVNEHDFDREQLTDLFNAIEMPEDIVIRLDNLRIRLQQPRDKTVRHVANRPLYKYRNITITAERINGGIHFWHTHKAAFDRMQQQFGIPAEIVLAIINNETDYGRFLGKHNALAALYTHAFYHPNRREFFTRELKEFLLLTREQNLDSNNLISSFDGGLGIAQFMPSSYRAYAIDFNNDGYANLYNAEDAIGSIANYLTLHGWEFDGPIIVPAVINDAELEQLDTLAIGPMHPNSRLDRIGTYYKLAEFADYHIYPDSEYLATDSLTGDREAILIKMEVAEQDYEYWLAFNNFSVITGYNTRREYAKTIQELSETIQQQFISDTSTQSLSVIHSKLPNLIDQIVEQYELDKATTISQLLAHVTIDENLITDYEYHQQQSLSWAEYRQHYITSNSIYHGAQYWQQYKEVLARAEANYGIPAAIIVATIGMANDYQKYPYPYKALELLTTLALLPHSDQEKYQQELGIFLSLIQTEQLDAEAITATIDGRIGIAAWLPSTYARYAIDFSGDSQRDLINNPIDAIGSIANYIKQLGWQNQGLIAVAAEVTGQDYHDIVNDSRQPNLSLAQLRELGVIPVVAIADNPKAMLIGITDNLINEYWLGFHNFYVLSRIQRDPQFVLAIAQLSQAIAEKYEQLQ